MTSRHGLVLGKFLPPHRGHLLLLNFALNFVDQLTVVVGSLAGEPISGELRTEWVRRLVPQARVVHLTDENPQYPSEHPDFWEIWRTSLQRVCPQPVDFLFASESYGEPLARVMNARFIPTNGWRETIPVSGTQIRQDPTAHWDALPDLVRPYFARKVTLFGPESTGKTTLAQGLAQHYRSLWVPEYARTYLQGRETEFTLEDMELIAQGQVAANEAARQAGHPLFFCDTDALTTELWCRELFGQCPPRVFELARKEEVHLTLLLDVDVPWVDDPLRFRPNQREQFLAACRQALDRYNRPYTLISGDWSTRFRSAVQAIEVMLCSS